MRISMKRFKIPLTCIIAAMLCINTSMHCLQGTGVTNDHLGFGSFKPDLHGLPLLQKFQARDKQWLSYRIYPSSNTKRALILLHGSSYHGAYLNEFAQYFSNHSLGTVYVPNVRGHFGSGNHRGDCEYIGQLEDDLIDLINYFNLKDKEIYLIGHSSGGGLAIRFAGSPYASLIKGFVLLSPVILTAPTMRQGTAGGWAQPHTATILLLSTLNACGITWFNHWSAITFNKPSVYCDGTETLTYSFNLNSSYHPRIPYQPDIAALKGKYLLLVGSLDEANDPAQFKNVMPDKNTIYVLDAVHHLDIMQDKYAMDMVDKWIKK